MSEIPSVEAYLKAIGPVGQPPGANPDPELTKLCENVVASLEKPRDLGLKHVVTEVEQGPEVVPVLAASVGLSQEALRSWLHANFGTGSWVNLSRSRGDELVRALDKEFELLAQLKLLIGRKWTLADVLAARMSARARGGKSVRQGRDLEDQVEAVVKAAGLSYSLRGTMVGRRGAEAPADVAIPAGGSDALIAIAIKGFDATGSKLSDAVKEVGQMVDARTPQQYVFVVVDGLGWHRRKKDLSRILEFWERDEISGVFTSSQLDELSDELGDAALRLKLKS